MINLLGIIPTREYIKTAHTSRLVQSNDAFDVHNTQTVIFSAFNRFLLTEQYIKRCLQMCIWYMDCRFINLYMPFVTPVLLWIWCANLLFKKTSLLNIFCYICTMYATRIFSPNILQFVWQHCWKDGFLFSFYAVHFIW